MHSSYFVHNGDFMKLDVATLGYTWNINNKWVEKARFYITGRNLFTISGYHRGLDKDAYCVMVWNPVYLTVRMDIIRLHVNSCLVFNLTSKFITL